MFDSLWWPIWYAVLVAVSAVALVLAGCSSGPFERKVAGTPVPASTTSAQGTAGSEPVVPGQEGRAAAFQVMRLVDPCALHSPAEAARVSGLIADEIMPGHALNVCKLELVRTPDALPLWTVSTTVGVEFDDSVRMRAQQQEINDIGFWLVPPGPFSNTASGTECTYVMEFEPDMGIQMRVQKRDETERGDACELARSYLLAVSKWWRSPAIRADKVTSPYLAVATADPCRAVAEVAGEQGTLAMSGPHSCRVQPKDLSAGVLGQLAVEFKVESDPRAILGKGSSEYSAVTVRGKPGTQAKLVTPGPGGQERVTCFVTVIADEQVVLQADQTRSDAMRSYQVIATRSSDCELAQRAAEAALASIS